MFNLCWHKWNEWSRVIASFGGSLHQVCRCEKCGAVKRRKAVSMMFGAHLQAEQVNSAIEAKLKEKNHG